MQQQCNASRACEPHHCCRARRDVTSFTGAPTTMVFPQRDDDGNLLETQYGRSRFRDQQVLPCCQCEVEQLLISIIVRAKACSDAVVWYDVLSCCGVQHLTIQELPETAPPGQLPRSCDIILEDDLVRCQPAGRVNGTVPIDALNDVCICILLPQPLP